MCVCVHRRVPHVSPELHLHSDGLLLFRVHLDHSLLTPGSTTPGHHGNKCKQGDTMRRSHRWTSAPRQEHACPPEGVAPPCSPGYAGGGHQSAAAGVLRGVKGGGGQRVVGGEGGGDGGRGGVLEGRRLEVWGPAWRGEGAERTLKHVGSQSLHLCVRASLGLETRGGEHLSGPVCLSINLQQWFTKPFFGQAFTLC